MSYTTGYDVLTKTGYTSEQLQEATDAVRTNGFNDFQAFVDAENTYGISSLYLLSHACVESAWATSEIAPNNIFGFNADDSNPAGDASSYPSQAACINDVASFLKTNYLTPGGKYYSGDTISDIFVHYSTSGQTEAATVADVMNLIGDKIPSATPAPSGSTYTVKAGDTLTSIAEAHGISLEALEAANPQIKDFNVIDVGEVINLPSGKTYTVVEGDTLSGIAAKFGLTSAEIEKLNPQIADFNLIKPGEVINV